MRGEHPGVRQRRPARARTTPAAGSPCGSPRRAPRAARRPARRTCRRSAGLDGVDDLVEHAVEHPEGVGLHGEHVGHRHVAAVDERHRAVPHVGRVLVAGHRLVARRRCRRRRSRRAGARRTSPRPGRASTARSAALARKPVMSGGAHHQRRSLVRLDEVAAASRTANWIAWLPSPASSPVSGHVLVAGDVHHRLEEPPLVALGRREVHREPQVGVGEPAVHVAVAHRLVAPLVDVDERLDVQRIWMELVARHGYPRVQAGDRLPEPTAVRFLRCRGDAIQRRTSSSGGPGRPGIDRPHADRHRRARHRRRARAQGPDDAGRRRRTGRDRHGALPLRRGQDGARRRWSSTRRSAIDRCPPPPARAGRRTCSSSPAGCAEARSATRGSPASARSTGSGRPTVMSLGERWLGLWLQSGLPLDAAAEGAMTTLMAINGMVDQEAALPSFDAPRRRRARVVPEPPRRVDGRP